MNDDQAGKVTGGTVERSGAHSPRSIMRARFGNLPAATMGWITSKVAPSRPTTSSGEIGCSLCGSGVEVLMSSGLDETSGLGVSVPGLL